MEFMRLKSRSLPFSEPGEWTVSFIETQDNVGNHDFQHVDNADVNIPGYLQSTLEVLSSVNDASPPIFESLSIPGLC